MLKLTSAHLTTGWSIIFPSKTKAPIPLEVCFLYPSRILLAYSKSNNKIKIIKINKSYIFNSK